MIPNRHSETRGEEQLYRDLFEQVPVPYHELDAEGRIRRVNAAECSLLGYKGPESLIGRYAWELVSFESQELARESVHRKLTGLETPRPFRRNLMREDGSRITVEIHESYVFNADGQVTGIRSILIDCSNQEAAYAALESQVALRTADLTRALEQIREREDEFRLLFLSNPHPMWVYDAETLAFLEVNNAAVMKYGYSREEFLSMKISDIRPSGEVPRLKKYLDSTRKPLRDAGEWKHLLKDGSLIDVQINSHDIEFKKRPAVLTFAIDVTRQKHLEEQLRQAQKMEAVGRLAGGVAHDFNNLLTVITGYGTMLAEEIGPSAPGNNALKQVLLAAERASALTKQLLAFSRKQNLELRLIDLNEVISGIGELARRLIGEDLQIQTRLKQPIALVKADPNQIEQVLLNLLINARDAMPYGGKITIETGDADLSPEYSADEQEAPVGKHIFFAVSDTGVGMSTETQAKVFEPFFTTKELGKGTGLGLSTVYGIVKQHNGHIRVYSEPGVGSTFKVYIPVSEDQQSRERVPIKGGFESLRGGETILVAEDDPNVRALCTQVLERLGYSVLVAADGYAALEKCREHKGGIDLLLTDVVMPGIDGRKLATAVSKLRPGIKTLFCSGYTGEAAIHRGTLLPQDSFLQKPYTPRHLAEAVREILARIS